jgi:glycogen operon protein
VSDRSSAGTIPDPLPGRSYPLGATPDPHGTNFAVFSEHADRVLICLFDNFDGSGERIYALPGRTGPVWHGYFPGVGPGRAYGYRVEGRYDPWAGDWFNPCKLLIDPYAQALCGSVDWDAPVFGYRRDGQHDLSVADLHDSAMGVPLSLVVDRAFDWGDDASPAIPPADTLIYETHVKGLTALHPDVPPALRGKYLGLVEPPILNHLKELGVTSVELLPVHAFVDEEFLVRQGLRNYWGYNTLGYFAPDGRYSSAGDTGGQVSEFKTMVKELHRNGFEVILDVVFNHTAEAGRDGPTLSFRGLDNRTYYQLDAHDRSRYLNYSGTGNTVNVEHPAVMRLVLDSLRHWVTEYHVDGFRFDLATTLGREEGEFRTRSRYFTAIYQDPVLAGVKLIAEPWDVGPAGYQLSHFPAGWSEWNDRFRDSARSFWLGHQQQLGDFALRFTGSADLFDRPGRGPYASVNYVTCHDGFTLADLVSYNQKHNEDNLESNGDGNDHNLSRNFGVEGASSDPQIEERRARSRRNLLATTILAHGLPMILGGDELTRTQRGNNNAYPQDNPVSWYRWALSEPDRDFLEFAKRLIALRRQYRVLRWPAYVAKEMPVPQVAQHVAWHDADGRELTPHDWERQAPRTLQLTLSEPALDGVQNGDPPLLILFNADERSWEFTVPPGAGSAVSEWIVDLDTNHPRGCSGIRFSSGQRLSVEGESLLLARGALPE